MVDDKNLEFNKGLVEMLKAHSEELTKMEKEISHPSHYCDGRKYEPMKVIMDWELDFALGNVIKYIARAGRKDNIIKDLLKAREYLNAEIAYLEDGNNK